MNRLSGSVSGGDTRTTLHALTLLKDVIGVFPEKWVKSACERVFSLMKAKVRERKKLL